MSYVVTNDNSNFYLSINFSSIAYLNFVHKGS